MTMILLGASVSADGSWLVDYDDVGLTIGHTCAKGTASGLILTVTRTSDSALLYSKDVSADFGKGRIVDRSNVPNSEVPVHVKGQVYPYRFDEHWIP